MKRNSVLVVNINRYAAVRHEPNPVTRRRAIVGPWDPDGVRITRSATHHGTEEVILGDIRQTVRATGRPYPAPRALHLTVPSAIPSAR